MMQAQVQVQTQEALVNWGEFNRQKWKCKVLLKRFQAPNSDAYCDSIFFLNQQGKIYLPPLNFYHPVEFTPTPTNKNFRIIRQWNDVADVMLREMIKNGSDIDFVLPPEISDIRPWIWAGFQISVQYTYKIKFPYKPEQLDSLIQRKINKANSEGYVVIKTDNFDDVHQCLKETETRKGFNHQLTIQDMKLAKDLLGEQSFRAYVCYSKDGAPVSASIILVLNKKCALGWVLGTKHAYLSHGVTQKLIDFSFRDLSSDGIGGFDFCGANIPSVSEAKSPWGGELVPYYLVRKQGIKELFRTGREWINFLKKHGG
ncbi:hypothetical protein J2736_005089 [Paenibacillus qinlingensis]|uniref:BioF2-like acetyltransferase domain-containing protein n=2 Tax=Paenibacillus qinlingensis TaxID=1837343 RepID=A0ABU1P2V0_9BACL|nr:GNAT family N-acetyltransferase [Paenibacillus qinlingensis]MDR6553879.1 hypothetical protein [Paenibacillus qinlingensis]